MLLQYGVDLAFKDRNGFNALHIAASAGYTDMVRMILNHARKLKKNTKTRRIVRDLILEIDHQESVWSNIR